MGYRSQVRCLIYGSEENLQAHIIGQVILYSALAISEFKENLTRYVIKGADDTEVHVLDLKGDSWKWYESYPDVKAWTEFMRSSPDMGLEYEFIRVGEEVGDVETETSSDPAYYIGISTPSIIDDMPEVIREVPFTS